MQVNLGLGIDGEVESQTETKASGKSANKSDEPWKKENAKSAVEEVKPAEPVSKIYVPAGLRVSTTQSLRLSVSFFKIFSSL